MSLPSSSSLRHWLRAVSNLTSAVNAGHDLGTLLDQVATTARELLELDFCSVMVPNSDGANLQIIGASGLPASFISHVNTEGRIRLAADPGAGSPASRAFLTGQPCAVGDLREWPDSPWSDVAQEHGYRSILSVPLVTGAGVIGTLNSYRATPHAFSSQDVEQLALLAEHAAIALTSARILDDLREQHRLIVRSEEIHERLLTVAVNSGGVSGIATALHELLGCDVLIRDLHGDVLATTDDGREVGPAPVAESPGHHPAADATRTLLRVVGPHTVVDVVMNGSVAATIWLLDRAEQLDALSVRAGEHASVVLSLELLRIQTAADVEQALRGELLADLLAGADPEARTVRERANRMGHNLSIRHHMLVTEVASVQPNSTRARSHMGQPGPADPDKLAQSAAADAVRRTSHLRPRPLIAAVGHHVVALWPTTIDAPVGTEVLRRAVSAPDPSAATVVVTQPAVEGIPAAYRVARGALRLAAAAGAAPDVIRMEDLGAAGILLQFVKPEVSVRYAERVLGPVRRYDDEHGSDLIGTLRTYLDCELDRRATANRLVVHPNTVTQRVQRIESLTGLRLRSPLAAIEARTALMLHDVVTAIESAEQDGS